jgi:FAD/FMN-containing dehydrogenase
MLARNYQLWKNASAIGGTRYLEDAVPFTKSDWQTHYGPVYPQFAAWKQRFDPYGILAPGPAIF